MPSDFNIPIKDISSMKSAGIAGYLRKMFFVEKMNNSTGAVLLTILAAIIGLSIGMQGSIAPAIILLISIIALPFLYFIIVYPTFGISVLLIMAYLLMWFIKMSIPFPIGTLVDGLEALLIVGFLLKSKYKPNWGMFKNPVSYIIIIWIIYNFIQIANPVAESRLAWVYTIRSVAMVMLMYFIFMYNVRTVSFLYFIIKLWLALSLFAAVYAVWQEYVGFLPFEEAGLSDPTVRGLLFIDGHWRKFSIFSDPVAFSYNMVASSLLCVGLMNSNLSRKKKRVLLLMCAFFMYVMLFSGTRGAYVLFPVGLAMLAVLKFSKKVFYIALVGLGIMLTLIFMPTSNYTLYRFQSAFKPSNDNSYKLRQYNQKRIQPYILSHPIGAGLGAAGAWGRRFSPNSFLSNFEVDSGYVRVAVELGWVGLFIFCTLMFIVLKTCITNYFKIRDPMLKSICLAMTLIAFALTVGNYPQEAFVQFPTSIYIYLVIALANVTLRLDEEKNKSQIV